ncbi:MAG: peptide chain release factor 1 [Opitutales bacterium]|nr:peptide chain release factor 1 [Opitutales bacterium]
MPKLPDTAPFNIRHKELDAQMAEPDFYGDRRRAAAVMREHQKLTQLIEMAEKFKSIEKQIADNRELAEMEDDAELREMALEEIPALEEQLGKIYADILTAMIPPEPSDSRNTIIEIRAGTGGDEASLFAADLFRMYQRYSEDRGWKVEMMGGSESEAGGWKEVSFLVIGEDVYKQLKFESGVHRVQRVPTTETQGRIHTSAATVAVLPEAEEVDVEIRPDEIEISIARASGPGGQGVNTTDSAVQILHKPTGMIVKCADERSQIKNKAKALKVLRSRLLERREEEEKAKYAAHRKAQIGSGDRSERIRTYNFPQGRLTDHRIGLTLYNLPEVMEGRIDEVITALQEADRDMKVQALGHSEAAE